MAWRDSYLDLMLIPLGLLLPVAYHAWLWRAIRLCPLRTTIGVNAAARRHWVLAVPKDHDTKAVLVVQSMRNVIMLSTLMATTAILLCTGIAALLSSTYAVKKQLSETVFGAHGAYMMAVKYVVLLAVFLLAFLCHTLAIGCLNQASFLINASGSPLPAPGFPVAGDYIGDVMDRAFTLNVAGNRLFYAGVPLLLWIFGPVLAFVASMAMIPILYNLDLVRGKDSNGGVTGKLDIDGSHECVEV